MTTNYRYQPFIQFARKHGVSLNNTFEIQYRFRSSSGVESTLRSGILGTPNYEDHLSFFVEEVDIPGVFLATGEYRYNNSPQLKYPYAKTFNKSTITYLLDGTMVQRKFYDIWLDYIYNLSDNRNYNYGTLGSNEFGTTRSPVHRLPYKEEYVCDITIVKYNRPVSCDGPFPDSASAEEAFFKPQYSVTLVNAFPSDITPISLSNAASDVTRFSVSFEYDVMRDSVAYGESSVNPDTSNPLGPDNYYSI